MYNLEALEDIELVKSDKFDLGEEDLDTLDQRLYLALKYLEIPEWWHLLGPNSPAGWWKLMILNFEYIRMTDSYMVCNTKL